MKKLILLISTISILLYACKDENIIKTPKLINTQATSDHTTAERIFNDVGIIIEAGFNTNKKIEDCPKYTFMNSNNSDIDTMIIDFGNRDCLYYGKLRKGKILVNYTNRFLDSLAVITNTFDNYYVNNKLVNGERIVTNQGRNSNGNIWFTIDVNNASISNSIGTINWESNRIREWVNGQNTLSILDDQYKITGKASGNGVNGNTFTMRITDTLNVDFGCINSCIIKSGSAKITPYGYQDRIINYGDSLCDCNIDVNINGIIYPLVLGN